MSNSLYYTRQGSGPALVLLHPVGIDHSFWGPLIEKAATLRTVIAVDLMGHGWSPAAAPDRGIGAFVSDLVALLDNLGFEKAGLLGLSFGGMIAQEFACSHPSRLSQLIVGACGPRIPPEARDAVRARGKPDASGMAGVVDATMQRWFTPAFIDAEPARRVRARLLSDDPVGWAAGWNAISGFDALDRLKTIAVPTLVVAGELDAGTPPAMTRIIADTIPGAEFKVLPGAPHMMQIECAGVFSDAVIEFLTRQQRTA